jgi:hypothetical protein
VKDAECDAGNMILQTDSSGEAEEDYVEDMGEEEEHVFDEEGAIPRATRTDLPPCPMTNNGVDYGLKLWILCLIRPRKAL